VIYVVHLLFLLFTPALRCQVLEDDEEPFLEAGGKIVEVDSTTIHQYTKQWTLLEFYSPLCGHCRKFAPEYAKVSEYLDGVMTVARLNHDTERTLASEFGVQFVPRVLLFSPEDTPPAVYEGRLTAGKILDWTTPQLPVFNLESMDSVLSYLQPPKLVYPSRYLLIDTEVSDESTEELFFFLW